MLETSVSLLLVLNCASNSSRLLLNEPILKVSFVRSNTNELDLTHCEVHTKFCISFFSFERYIIDYCI